MKDNRFFVLAKALAFAWILLLGKPAIALQDTGPLPENYKDIILNYLEYFLVDPDSVKDLTFHPPIEVNQKDLYFKPETERLIFWKVCVTFNAKNKFGGYTGLEAYMFEFQYGEITSSRGNGTPFCDKPPDVTDSSIKPPNYKIKHLENPSYPSKAAQRGITGFVQLKFDITEEGIPTNIRVIYSSPEGYFEEVSIEAVSNSRYETDGFVKGVKREIRFDINR